MDIKICRLGCITIHYFLTSNSSEFKPCVVVTDMGQIMQFVMISITLAGKGQDYAICNDFNNFGR